MTQSSKNRIKLLIPILICLIGMAGILVYEINHYRQLSFQRISNLCQTIIELHPEAEEEVLSSLKEYSKGANQGEQENEFLLQYGCRSSDFGGGFQSGFVLLTIIVFLLIVGSFLIVYWYTDRYNRKRIEELTDYLECVNIGKFDRIIQTKEDCFSQLEDEIYKTVTTLRQTRDTAVKTKENYADNLANIAHQLKTKITMLLGSCTVYQKAVAVCLLPNDLQSDELKALGGLGTVAGSSVTSVENGHLVKAPLMIMDDKSFEEYCTQIGITPNLDGTIMLNCIWDNINSNFRYKQYIPFVNESQNVISVQNRDNANASVEIEVLAYTQEIPILREEYDNYALVQFISLSMWENIVGTIGNAEADMYVSVLADAELSLEEANTLEIFVVNMIGNDYVIESENRIQEKASNDEMMDGFMMIIGAFCILLATIGIANVFSNTLGFIQQRKREFVQYMSIGMTEANIRKMLSIEALVIAGRPLLITLPLTVVFVGFMITSSYLDPMEFLVEAPTLEISLFIVAIFVFVGLAYYLGGRRILKADMAETLRNDTLV